MSFDSLTFARRLKAAGFSEAQAEALADANREMVVHDTATKDDLASVKTALKADIVALEARLMSVIENQTLRLTVRVGVMLAAAFSLTTAIIGNRCERRTAVRVDRSLRALVPASRTP
jgi:ethanolamine ammonia-lyase large subunit